MSAPVRSPLAIAAALLVLWVKPAAASDGAYGRLEGDATLGAELGGSYLLAPAPARGPSLAVRASFVYLHTVGVAMQYDDLLGSSEAVARTLSGAVEIRPLFIGRFSRNLEQGPAHLDLLLDSFGLLLGAWGSFERDPGCGRRCGAHGMEFGAGIQVPFLPQASTPYLGLRAVVRWTLSDLDAAHPTPPPIGLLTLTVGYQQLFAIHLVDAADRIER
jgi:hypothetical protein